MSKIIVWHLSQSIKTSLSTSLLGVLGVKRLRDCNVCLKKKSHLNKNRTHNHCITGATLYQVCYKVIHKG